MPQSYTKPWILWHHLSSTIHMPTLGSHYLHQRKCHCDATVEFDISFVHIEMVQEVENKLEPRQNGRHFVDNIYKHIFFNENIWISIKISLKFVSQGPINNIPALVQIMAWRRPGSMNGSVRPSVCLWHLFDYVPVIVSSWNFQKLLPLTEVMSMRKVKVRGQRSRSQRSWPHLAIPDCNSSLNYHMMMKWCI